MTDVSRRKRQPKGAPASAGGEFAKNEHDDATAPLGDAPSLSDDAALGFQTAVHEKLNTAERKERIQAAFDEVKGFVDDLDKDANWNLFLEQSAKFHRMSFMNSMLITLQMPEATRVNSVKRWNDLGRRIKKGTKGITIIRPIFAKDDKKKTDDGEKESTRLIGFTPVTTFDISQTEGDDLAEIWAQSSAEPHPQYVSDLEEAIKRTGFRVEYRDLSTDGGRRGYTNFGDKLVVIDSSSTPGSQASTLSHELGHIQMGHGDEGDKYHTGLGGERSRMEVEAESFSYILGKINGFDDDTRHSAEYLKSWNRDSNDELRKVAEKVKNQIKKITEDSSHWSQMQD